MTWELDSLLGTGRQLSVGPEAALSLLVGEAISRFIAEETHAHPDITAGQKLKIALAISTILTFEAGIITFMLGIFRVSQWDWFTAKQDFDLTSLRSLGSLMLF